jgi:hypothetical protein
MQALICCGAAFPDAQLGDTAQNRGTGIAGWVRAPVYAQRRPVADVTEMCFPGNHIAKQNRETVCRAGMSPVEDHEDLTPKALSATPVAVDPRWPARSVRGSATPTKQSSPTPSEAASRAGGSRARHVRHPLLLGRALGGRPVYIIPIRSRSCTWINPTGLRFSTTKTQVIRD